MGASIGIVGGLITFGVLAAAIRLIFTTKSNRYGVGANDLAAQPAAAQPVAQIDIDSEDSSDSNSTKEVYLAESSMFAQDNDAEEGVVLEEKMIPRAQKSPAQEELLISYYLVHVYDYNSYQITRYKDPKCENKISDLTEEEIRELLNKNIKMRSIQECITSACSNPKMHKSLSDEDGESYKIVIIKQNGEEFNIGKIKPKARTDVAETALENPEATQLSDRDHFVKIANF